MSIVTNRLRQAVSLEKRRYQRDGFDLDLTYITPNVVAMGYPSTGTEAAFRNPAKECKRFLDLKHKSHYKVYNLCSERNYDPILFDHRVEYFPFDDHNAPPFQMVFDCCASVQQWLDANEENVAVLHCKAGKGRTGVMICCWMIFSGMWPEADASLEFYGAMRTKNRQGVTIPSQRRYVRYFGDAIRRLRLAEDLDDQRNGRLVGKKKAPPKPPPKDPHVAAQFNAEKEEWVKCASCDTGRVPPGLADDKKECPDCKAARLEQKSARVAKFLKDESADTEDRGSRGRANRGQTLFAASTIDLERRRRLWAQVYTVEPLQLSSITLAPAPIGVAMSDLRFVVHKLKSPLLTWTPTDAEGLGNGAKTVELDTGDLRLAGDIKVTFFVKEEKNKLLHFWFNTHFVRRATLTLYQPDIDDANKDKGKLFEPGFHVDLNFRAKPTLTSSDPLSDAPDNPNHTMRVISGQPMPHDGLFALGAQVKGEDDPKPGERRGSTAAAVALAGRAVPLSGVDGEVLHEGGLHVLAMRQDGVFTRVPVPPRIGAAAAAADDTDTDKLLRGTAGDDEESEWTIALSPRDMEKAPETPMSPAGETARSLDAKSRHWCVLDNNNGFGARLSIGSLDKVKPKKKKDAGKNARLFTSRGVLFVRGAGLQVLGRKLRLVSDAGLPGDGAVDMLVLSADDAFDAAVWKQVLLEHGAVEAVETQEDDEEDDDTEEQVEEEDDKLVRSASKPETPAPAPTSASKRRVRVKRKKKKRRNICHKCKERNVAARVFIDGLHVMMCRNCTVNAMQAFNGEEADGSDVVPEEEEDDE